MFERPLQRRENQVVIRLLGESKGPEPRNRLADRLAIRASFGAFYRVLFSQPKIIAKRLLERGASLNRRHSSSPPRARPSVMYRRCESGQDVEAEAAYDSQIGGGRIR